MQKRDKMPLIYVYGYSCLVYLVYLLHDWTILSLRMTIFFLLPEEFLWLISVFEISQKPFRYHNENYELAVAKPFSGYFAQSERCLFGQVKNTVISFRIVTAVNILLMWHVECERDNNYRSNTVLPGA